MSIVYCIITAALFLFAGFITRIGPLAGVIMVANEFIGNINVFSVIDTFRANNDMQQFVFFIIIVQSYYISRIFELLTDDAGIADHLYLALGNLFLGCFLGIMYASFPTSFLLKLQTFSSLAVAAPTAIVMFVAMGFLIHEHGVKSFIYIAIGIPLFAVLMLSLIGTSFSFLIIIIGIGLMIGLIVTNPILLGVVAALLPSFITLIAIAIVSVLPLPSVILLILCFPASYFLNLLCSEIVNEVTDYEDELQTFFNVISVIFFVFSVVVIVIWVKTVLITPTKHTVVTEAQSAETVEGHILHHGYIGNNGTWDLYSDGVLEIYSYNNLEKYTDAFPWKKYEESVHHIQFSGYEESIGNRWFMNYKNLETVCFPDNLETISEHAFQGCEKLRYFSINDSEFFTCIDGALFSRNGGELVLCPNTSMDDYHATVEENGKWYDSLLGDKKLIFECYQKNNPIPVIYYSRNFHQYTVYDIDQDGIEELFLATVENPWLPGDYVIGLRLTDDRGIECFDALDCSLGDCYLMGKNYFVSYQRISGADHYFVKAFDTGQVLYDLSSGQGEDGISYYQDGESVTEKEYFSIYNEYVKTAVRLSYSDTIK